MVLVLTVGSECVQEADGRGEGSVRPKGLALQEVCLGKAGVRWGAGGYLGESQEE